MKIERIYGIYFSPAGSTEQVVRAVVTGAEKTFGSINPQYIDLTPPQARTTDLHFGPGDLLVIGSPTYAGRLPNKIVPDLRAHILGGTQDPGPLCLPVVTFGNRSYDESLKELAQLMKKNGFTVVAGAAAVCRHAFTDQLAEGRPDAADLDDLATFGGRAAGRILEGSASQAPGTALTALLEEEVGSYYTPRQEDGTPAKFLKVKSKADPGKCNRCMLCAAVCPMGSIDRGDPFSVPGICIKCQACVRKCPVGARYFDDPQFLSHVRMLERDHRDRKENVYL